MKHLLQPMQQSLQASVAGFASTRSHITRSGSPTATTYACGNTTLARSGPPSSRLTVPSYLRQRSPHSEPSSPASHACAQTAIVLPTLSITDRFGGPLLTGCESRAPSDAPRGPKVPVHGTVSNNQAGPAKRGLNHDRNADGGPSGTKKPRPPKGTYAWYILRMEELEAEMDRRDNEMAKLERDNIRDGGLYTRYKEETKLQGRGREAQERGAYPPLRR
ncbi:hypothetical protein QBC46DRAFT_178590 [Diplogelasinospora grovesii]|uniref:Uncharacterized protein n=1 Tax=Diplogelasinospora grovesii TaxID=303347 RepID=A0AAN6N200_9PEZI|nr:hypothetical protein QBC46DRAFT_178590 [Diplogelasinospora grovesii]